MPASSISGLGALALPATLTVRAPVSRTSVDKRRPQSGSRGDSKAVSRQRHSHATSPSHQTPATTSRTPVATASASIRGLSTQAPAIGLQRRSPDPHAGFPASNAGMPNVSGSSPHQGSFLDGARRAADAVSDMGTHFQSFGALLREYATVFEDLGRPMLLEARLLRQEIQGFSTVREPQPFDTLASQLRHETVPG